jgi:hypothetical protein
MCIPAIGAAIAGSSVASMGASAAAGISAAAFGAFTSVAGLGLSYYQQAQAQQVQQAQFNYQVAATQQQNNLAYQNAQRQAFYEREAQAIKHQGDVRAQQAQMLAYNQNVFNSSEAVNRVYTAEQMKLKEARDKAAFKSQEIYAKSIGSLGRVLSTGATGQSVGLLAMDTQRQAGIAAAQQSASLRSATDQYGVNVSMAQLKQESDNNMALSRVSAPVQAPRFAPEPTGFGTNLGLGIPSYRWA